MPPVHKYIITNNKQQQQQQQSVLWSLIKENPGDPVTGNTQSLTHSLSLWILFIEVTYKVCHLLQFTATSLLSHQIIQSFSTTSLQVFFSLPLGPALTPPRPYPCTFPPTCIILTPFSKHAHTQPVSLYQCNILSVPSLSLNSLHVKLLL